MSRLTGADVLERIWADSGDEDELSDSEFENNDNSDESEGSDQDGAELSSEDEVVNDVEDEDSSQDETPPKRKRQQRPVNPDRQWVRANLSPPQNVPFTGQSEIHVNTDGFEPIDFFKLFIDDDLMNYLVAETNTFAEQFVRDNNLKRRSRVHEWYPTNPKEMKEFLGLTFLMGIVQKPTISMYWSNDPLYSTPIFKQVMNRDRYLLLLKFLHYNNNDNMPAPNDENADKLFKLRPLVDHLFEKFQDVYTPSREICIDESLLLWKGSDKM